MSDPIDIFVLSGSSEPDGENDSDYEIEELKQDIELDLLRQVITKLEQLDNRLKTIERHTKRRLVTKLGDVTPKK